MPSFDFAPPSVDAFALGTALAAAAVVGAAALFRSRSYALFRGVQLTVHGLVASALYGRALEVHAVLAWVFCYLHACVHVQSMLLVRPRMRPPAYRLAVSLPDAFFQAGTLLGFPWAIAAAFGWQAPGWWLGYLLAGVGMVQCFVSRPERVDLVVRDGHGPRRLARWSPGRATATRPLRIVQITDCHLGPFMPPSRLRAFCRRAVEREPDLVLLTGDFLTMESQNDPGLLIEGLEPLAAMTGRTFACLGNHDLEAPETVRRALEAAGVRLLVDEAETVVTEAGRVQILGADFTWRERGAHLESLCRAHPRDGDALRVLLLHDPAAFAHVPEAEVDLALSGHTHGGQLGLVSLGLAVTLVSAVSRSPDHGFWARGRDRLYVHRGTGHYGFPIRLGVPLEDSLLQVHDEAASPPARGAAEPDSW